MTDMHTAPGQPPSTLSRLGVLSIDGPDAATFLQGQATCDCRQLDAQHGALGALCNLQGRMIVSFYVVAVDGGLRLLMPRDRIGAVLTHLKKFAVFSKVQLRDDSSACLLSGDVDDRSGAAPFTVSGDAATGRCLRLRGGRALYLRAATGDAASHHASRSSVDEPAGADSSGAESASECAWRAAAIRAGELLVDSANADRFLPQALNYDVIDGVNFRKGCYTGQEVVARMHFKGKMKERLTLASAATSTAPAAGTRIVHADGRLAGEVVDAVIDRNECLVGAVIRRDAATAGDLRLGDETGPELHPGSLPYALPGEE